MIFAPDGPADSNITGFGALRAPLAGTPKYGAASCLVADGLLEFQQASRTCSQRQPLTLFEPGMPSGTNPVNDKNLLFFAPMKKVYHLSLPPTPPRLPAPALAG